MQADNWRPSGIVTLLSDFGMVDPYAGIMRGVILRIAPQARLVDLTHSVAPQSVASGALLLRSAVEYFPAGTVHLAVVDPGVGSDRAPILVVTEHAVLVGPDNGLLYPSAQALGLREVRRLDAEGVFLEPVSHTFHGRDIFAPVAGHLAAGRSPSDLGSLMEEMQSLAATQPKDDGRVVIGSVVHIDHFGNLVSNIPVAGLRQPLSIEIADWRLDRLSSSYSDEAAGKLVAIEGSWGMLEIARNGGSAAETLGCGVGAVVVVRRGGEVS